jgi:thymidine kinase
MFMMNKIGLVEVICGSMFSGKSEELIRRVRQAKYGNLSVHVFKPAVDDRFSEDSVVSHNGSSSLAYPVKTALEILEHIDCQTDIDIVAIDVLLPICS